MRLVNEKPVVIRINGDIVDQLFDADGKETFDPTEAVEYADDFDLQVIHDGYEVSVTFNPSGVVK